VSDGCPWTRRGRVSAWMTHRKRAAPLEPPSTLQSLSSTAPDPHHSHFPWTTLAYTPRPTKPGEYGDSIGGSPSKGNAHKGRRAAPGRASHPAGQIGNPPALNRGRAAAGRTAGSGIELTGAAVSAVAHSCPKLPYSSPLVRIRPDWKSER